jgi:hypothetical protein
MSCRPISQRLLAGGRRGLGLEQVRAAGDAGHDEALHRVDAPVADDHAGVFGERSELRVAELKQPNTRRRRTQSEDRPRDHRTLTEPGENPITSAPAAAGRRNS